MTIDEIAAKMNPHTPWTVWRGLVSAVEIEAATLDAMVGPPGHNTFTAFSAEGFRLERGQTKVIVTRAAGEVTWSRISQLNAATLPVKTGGKLDVIGDRYLLHGSAFSDVKQVALFLLNQLNS